MSLDVEAFIRERLPLEPVIGTPEVRLHRAGPHSGLMRLAEADPDFEPPYWSRPWGGGLVLARHVLDHPAVVAERRVMDLGCGSGLLAIAAALAGAAEVVAVDIDPYAITAARLNAAANGVALSYQQADLTREAPPDVDLILVGDLFYARGLARRVEAFVRRCQSAGVEVLIGDPGRDALPTSRLRLVAEHPVVDYGDPGGAVRNAAVYALS